jgi:hypothetical protein
VSSTRAKSMAPRHLRIVQGERSQPEYFTDPVTRRMYLGRPSDLQVYLDRQAFKRHQVLRALKVGLWLVVAAAVGLAGAWALGALG